MKPVYFGERTPRGTRVCVQHLGGKCTALPTYKHLLPGGVEGFAWGTGDRQADQLAFALCCHILGDAEKAMDVYPEITRRVVAPMHPKEWVLRYEDLLAQILLVQSLLVGAPE